MNLIRLALRRPVTILVVVASLFFFGARSVGSVKVDIFPALDLPVIYISHPFSGYTPEQMEAYFGKNYVNILLFVNGIKAIETKNIQGLTLMKISFYEGTNMAQAAAELSAFSNRIQAAFPPGSQPPFIVRFDASTLPVGQLVISSPKRSNNELQDLANVYVRSSFTSIPGLVSPPPFGGNARTIEIRVDPGALRAHNLTPDQVVEALRLNNQTAPSGNVRVGDVNYIARSNATIPTVKEFEDIPLFKGDVHNLYVRDVATVRDGADVTSGYALVNGKRSVYMQITKSADASTWEVVQRLKAALPRFQSSLPEDVTLSYEFDQSTYVINAVESLLSEGAIGALLTGLMVLFFLGDPRGAGIVIMTIPTSIISSVLFLQLFGQTINIMTLSGLALAIGILVDESTVTIENIHQHLAMGKPKPVAIWEACQEIAFPKLLILFCIMAVFAPALSMSGIPGSLFRPLALAIGFAMITSYLLSQTFVPVMANWLMKGGHAHLAHAKPGRFDRFRAHFLVVLDALLARRRALVVVYALVACLGAGALVSHIGRDVLPKTEAGQFQVRLRAPEGTRVEETEKKVIATLDVIEGLVGKENVAVSSAYVGLHPSLYSISPIYLFMGGPQEAVVQVQFGKEHRGKLDAFKEAFRARMKTALPDVAVSFEPVELTEKILSQGAATPIEVRIVGRNKAANEAFAKKVMASLGELDFLRDLQLAQSIRYPTLDIDVDRLRAAQLGVDVSEIARSLIASTSSSRYTDKNTWIDRVNGLSYNVQVEVPESQMSSLEDVGEISVRRDTLRPVLGDVATLTKGTTYGEADNVGAMPMLSITANVHGKDLGSASDAVKAALGALGPAPRGLSVEVKGLTETLTDTLQGLRSGLVVALVVIFLMLAANFQSFKLSLAVLTTAPAVLVGSLTLLLLAGSTLNLQSYMGIIMSVGVSIANAVLLVTNAEELRQKSGDAVAAAREAASLRIRPIVMTSLAMIVGMIPMAIGHGEGGDQVSPLGRAVIGGLFASTFATLLVLPLAFAWVQGRSSTASVSLDPNDPESKYFAGAVRHGAAE
ncbi:MAG: efflux RND transporter permease subunit [Labilithrix sp.]|nr:efflux RND transporter permease subunit [Labilithrix sp.]